MGAVIGGVTRARGLAGDRREQHVEDHRAMIRAEAGRVAVAVRELAGRVLGGAVVREVDEAHRVDLGPVEVAAAICVEDHRQFLIEADVVQARGVLERVREERAGDPAEVER